MAAQLTREFSICLVPTDDITNDIETLRQALPASPYRDDIPHITLLRGITSGTDMTDEALVRDVDSILAFSRHLPLGGSVRSIANKSNQFYTDTGVLLLDTSPELLAFRQRASNDLTLHGYRVEAQELGAYTPHVTVRLGVPLAGAILQRAERTFIGRTTAFSRWLLFRLVVADGKRLMHEVWPRPL